MLSKPHTLMHSRGTAHRRMKQHGFSMLETLVTLLIIAIWLLGSAGVQTIAMKLNKSSSMRNQAILLAAEVGERIENNRRAASDGTSYKFAGTKPSSAQDCIGPNNACTPAQLAAFDLNEIYKRGVDNNTTVTIDLFAQDTNTVTYSILVTWIDRRTNQTYSTTGTNEEVGKYTSYKTIYKLT